jgi:hypothetical protein
MEKFKSGESSVRQDAILAMAVAYVDPILSDVHRLSECPIGRLNVSEISIAKLLQIVQRLLTTMNLSEKERDRLGRLHQLER